MSSILQPGKTPLLDLDDVVVTLEETLHGIGFVKDGCAEQIYAVEVEIVDFPEITMKMSDGSEFKLTVEEVQ